MTTHRANCAVCAWSYEDDDQEAVADALERHARKEQHHVDFERAVATDGGVATDCYVVSNTGGIVYGPSVRSDGYVLMISTEESRLEIELDEDAMYTLWTEVKGVPWPEPEHMGEKDRLVRQVLHAANGADEEGLREALRVLGGQRP